MDLETIELGAAPNDRTGTNLRTAGGIINNNFEALDEGKLDKDDPIFTGALSIGDAAWQGTDPAFVHARTIASAAASPHAFSDSAALSFAGGLAYNSFEARFVVSGSGNYDHFSGYQFLPLIGTSGTTTNVWGAFIKTSVDTGVVTNNYGADIRTPVLTNGGTIGTSTGLRIQAQEVSGVTAGYGIVQDGAADTNTFAGFTTFGDTVLAMGTASLPDHSGALELRFNPAGSGTAIVNGASRSGGVATAKALVINGLTVGLRTASVDRAIVNDNGIAMQGSLQLRSYTVGTLPSASAHGAGAVVWCSDETGGAVPVFSDATNWRRVTDRNIAA